MKRFLVGASIFGGVVLAFVLGLLVSRTDMSSWGQAKPAALSSSEVSALVQEYSDSMNLKVTKGQLTQEQATTAINNYCTMLGVCDHQGVPCDGSHQQFADLTAEKVAELIQTKSDYLNELVTNGTLTAEEAAVRLEQYSNMLNSRLNGTWIGGTHHDESMGHNQGHSGKGCRR